VISIFNYFFGSFQALQGHVQRTVNNFLILPSFCPPWGVKKGRSKELGASRPDASVMACHLEMQLSKVKYKKYKSYNSCLDNFATLLSLWAWREIPAFGNFLVDGCRAMDPMH
jgi:hypothetical protein